MLTYYHLQTEVWYRIKQPELAGKAAGPETTEKQVDNAPKAEGLWLPINTAAVTHKSRNAVNEQCR